MACTVNVEIGKKQIDKQSGRIKESFWVSHTMENYHAPKSKFIQCGKPGKGKVRNGAGKILYEVSNTVERIVWSKQPMRNTLSGAVWTTSTSTLAIENGNSANLSCWHMNRDILVIAICWCVCVYIPYQVCLCSKYIMFDHLLWTHQPLQSKGEWANIPHTTPNISPASYSKPNAASPNEFVCIILFYIPSCDSSLFHMATLLATHHYHHCSNKRDWSFGFAQIQRISDSWSI